MVEAEGPRGDWRIALWAPAQGGGGGGGQSDCLSKAEGKDNCDRERR